MQNKYIIAIDQGTTSTRAILFDLEKNIVNTLAKDLMQIYPNPSWVEQDPVKIYDDVLYLIKQILEESKISAKDILGIGITNQRETTVVFDKMGNPIYNAVVWQCRRTSSICTDIINDGMENVIKEKTGLPIDPYFCATKIKWILSNVEGAYKKAENGELLFGTIDTWLVYKLTNNKVFATDRTNASRTMLYNINTLKWDKELCDYFKIPISMLPRVYPSANIYGYTSVNGENIPICAIAGDQQAALFGQECNNDADVKCTYGTGCFLLMNTDKKRVHSENGLVTTIAATKGDKVQYVLEGSVFSGGSVVLWLKDELGILNSVEESEQFAQMVDSTQGVVVVSAFTGLGAPYWDMYAKASITGISRGTNKYHITRACLESIAYGVHDVLKAMEKDTNIHINTLKVDGKASNNNFLMQFQSDINNIIVKKPKIIESTAIGIYYLAILALGIEKVKINENEKEFVPKMDECTRQQLLLNYKKAVNKTLQNCII